MTSTEPTAPEPCEKHGPVPSTWFRIGQWPTCEGGFAPRDNGLLTGHWREHGFEVVDHHDQLVKHPVASAVSDVT